jgi:lantibiotic modifying enzyme
MGFPSETELISLALRIGERILSDARDAGDGSLTWGRGFDVLRRPTQDAGLFNGRMGEALLFAALASSTCQSRFADASERVAFPLRSRLRVPGGADSVAQEIGLGLTGLGSVLYALVRIGKYLDSASFIADASCAATGISDAMIRSDTHFEFWSGSAALVMGLLAVSDTGVGNALEKARTCGTHLLANRVADPVTGLRAWPTQNRLPSVGFAHGSTGIAHALMELHQRTGDRSFYEAALEAFEFERAIVREDIGDWPDVRDQTSPVFCGWCHGAAGVGFSRLAGIDSILEHDQSPLLTDLHRALSRTAAYLGTADPDNLCCGHFGRADFLFETGIRIGNHSLIQIAKSKIATRLEDATDDALFALPVYENQQDQPGMWQGLTGVAYSILRFASPEVHSCILLLR